MSNSKGVREWGNKEKKKHLTLLKKESIAFFGLHPNCNLVSEFQVRLNC